MIAWANDVYDPWTNASGHDSTNDWPSDATIGVVVAYESAVSQAVTYGSHRRDAPN